MTDAQHSESAIQMANSIKVWWEAHKFDVRDGDHNVYDDAPEFVDMAKTVIGDWEQGTFSAHAYHTAEQYWIHHDIGQEQTGFQTLEEAKAWADMAIFNDAYEVEVWARGPHSGYCDYETVYSRNGRCDISSDKRRFNLKAYRGADHLQLNWADQTLTGFTDLEDAKGIATSHPFQHYYEVAVYEQGPDVQPFLGNLVYSRRGRVTSA
jgi:hypothetical protein